MNPLTAVALSMWLAFGMGGARAEAQSVDATASPAPTPKNLSVILGVGSINSPGGAGAATWGGLRLAIGAHLAASLDLGYGLVGSAPSAQDRWWLIPALALVIPAGSVRVDLGLGAGVGTSSGYPTWSSYSSSPFMPAWHDTVPIVRGHLTVARPLSTNVDVFARAEVASLLFAPTHDGTLDTLWLSLWLGVQLGVL